MAKVTDESEQYVKADFDAIVKASPNLKLIEAHNSITQEFKLGEGYENTPNIVVIHPMPHMRNSSAASAAPSTAPVAAQPVMASLELREASSSPASYTYAATAVDAA